MQVLDLQQTYPEANIKIAVDGYFIAVEDRVTLTDTFSAYDSDGNPISTELVTLLKEQELVKLRYLPMPLIRKLRAWML